MALQCVEADEGAAEVEEGLMDALQAFVADRQAPVAVQPGEGALHHPALAPQPGLALDAFARNAALDAPSAQVAAAAAHVAILVGVELLGPLATAAMRLPDRRDALEQRLAEHPVRAVGPARPDGEGEALGVGGEVVLAAGLGAVGRVRAGRLIPPLPGRWRCPR